MASAKENRIITAVAVYILAWTVALIAVPFYAYQQNISNEFLKTLVYVSCAGGLGGIVYAIASVCKHVLVGDFKAESFWWYIFRPLTGIIMGAVSYFLIMGGLLSLGGNGAPVDYAKNRLFYCGVAFLAGFAVKQFAEKLRELAKTLFATSAKQDESADDAKAAKTKQAPAKKAKKRK